VESDEEEDEEGEFASGRRSRPINLATKVGVLVPGEEISLKLLSEPVLILMFF
jgi:hypothetical protein